MKTAGLAGHTLLPREIAQVGHDIGGWRNYELTKYIATTLGESNGSVGAWHDNLAADGVTVTSRDCGLDQVNIAARFIGTAVEDDLRTESLDPAVYLPVITNNVKASRALYDSPWIRNGKTDIRRWNPWVAYLSGWATFPEFWDWKQSQGVPTGPWVPSPRYIHRAISAQMNFHIRIVQDWTSAQALTNAQKYAAHFKIDPTLCYVNAANGLIGFHIPPKPTADPADGVGPRPIPNDGV